MSDVTRILHEIVVDTDTRELVIDGKSIKSKPYDFRIFDMLAQSSGTGFTRKAIIESDLGDDSPTVEPAVNVHVASLRKKLGTKRDLIETVPTGILVAIPPGIALI